MSERSARSVVPTPSFEARPAPLSCDPLWHMPCLPLGIDTMEERGHAKAHWKGCGRASTREPGVTKHGGGQDRGGTTTTARSSMPCWTRATTS